MSVSKRAIRVFQVPQTTIEAKRVAFLSEIRLYAENERPRLVLDCTNLVSLDVDTVELLLCSLEEAMKGNGDVRLAALTPYALAALSRIGIARLFETYNTTDLAIQSYQRASSQTFTRHHKHTENAA